MGDEAGYNITDGAKNTCVGHDAGGGLTTGSNNILLGHDSGRAGSPSGNLTTHNNNVCLGDDDIANLYCADTSISSSDERDKTDIERFNHGLSWINKLSPVTYRWDKRSWYSKDLSATPDGSKKRNQLHIGFLAQEHLEVEKEHGFGDGKENMLVTDLTEDGNRYGMKYERLVPVLVNAIKELSAKNDALEARLAALEK